MAIMRSRRSSKGRWIAIAELTTWATDDHNSGKGSPLEIKECPGRKAAESAAQAMLCTHACKFSMRRSVEVEIMLEIEWRHAIRRASGRPRPRIAAPGQAPLPSSRKTPPRSCGCRSDSRRESHSPALPPAACRGRAAADGRSRTDQPGDTASSRAIGNARMDGILSKPG